MVRSPSGVTRIRHTAVGRPPVAGAGLEGDAGGADVVPEHLAELVVGDAADEGALAAERGEPGDRVGRRAAGTLHRRAHEAIQTVGLLRIDEAHEALGEVVLRQEAVLAASDDVDDRIADADNVVARLLHAHPNVRIRRTIVTAARRTRRQQWTRKSAALGG